MHGFQQWRDMLTGHQACPLQMMCGVQTRSAADIARELDIHWIVHRIVQDQQDYGVVCAHWVKRNPTDGANLIVWAFLIPI